jgi:hypothetical protein
MSRRPPPPELPPLEPPVEPLDRDPEDDDEDDDEDELDPEELLVEYFVDVLELLSVLTSVPKSTQLSHTSSSAPSTFTVFGEDVSAPHISHWTIPTVSPRPRINRTPPPRTTAPDTGRTTSERLFR